MSSRRYEITCPVEGHGMYTADSPDEECPSCADGLPPQPDFTEDDEEDTGTCHICQTSIDWSKGGNGCCRCGEPMCEDHTDYTFMREVHEATGNEGVAPICTRCTEEIRAMSPEDQRKEMERYPY